MSICWTGLGSNTTYGIQQRRVLQLLIVDGSVEEAMGGAPSHDATCHGASRLVSRSDIERFKGMAFDKASIQAVSSVLWNPSNFIIYGEESSRNGMSWRIGWCASKIARDEKR
ncbi:hypothetical protein Peur_003872 [Populus x canadensis]